MDHNGWGRAFKDSLPVLMGYLTMGAAAGILLAGTLPELPCVPLWAASSSAWSISGALQFIMVGWIREHSLLADVTLLTVFLNFRYALYGFSLLERFRGIPLWKKCYLIWTLTDETFALQCAFPGEDREKAVAYSLRVAFLDHLYWITGVTAGALIGAALPFGTRGIDFAMTALFLVILTDQLREKKNRLPALTGLLCAVPAGCFFSVQNMLIPAAAGMIAVFLIFRKKFAPRERSAS